MEPEDQDETLESFRKAAEQGDAKAQVFLGFGYAQGNGVPQDIIQAYMWFNLAAVQGDKAGRAWRDYAAKGMTSADISKAQALAREWMEKHQE